MATNRRANLFASASLRTTTRVKTTIIHQKIPSRPSLERRECFVRSYSLNTTRYICTISRLVPTDMFHDYYSRNRDTQPLSSYYPRGFPGTGKCSLVRLLGDCNFHRTNRDLDRSSLDTLPYYRPCRCE